MGAGSKGVRLYDWARARLPYVTEEGWVQWLVARRSVSSPEEMAYYRAYAPQETPLAELARVASTRWSIEECFERAKGGSGSRSLRGQALGGLASAHHALPAGACLPRSDTHPCQRRGGKRGSSMELIPFTAPEVRRLLLALARPVEEHGFLLRWSEWRRRRQAAARRCHYRR